MMKVPTSRKRILQDKSFLDLFNATNIDMFINPNGNWQNDIHNFDSKKLNFSWKAISYKNNDKDKG